MNWIVILIIVIALGTVISGILLLKQSATKFNLTPKQLEKIKQRNQALDKEEQERDK